MTADKNSIKNLISTIEAAKRLKVAHVTIYNYLKNGKLEAIKLGRDYFIEEKSIKKFLAANYSKKGGRPKKNIE